MNWQNKCQLLIQIGIISVDKRFQLAGRKTVSLLFWSLWVNCRAILYSKNPHIMVDTLYTVGFWTLETAFIRPRNITFDRLFFHLTIRLLYGPGVSAGNWTNLQKTATLKKRRNTHQWRCLYKESDRPRKSKTTAKKMLWPIRVLESAKNMETGLRNELTIKTHS